METTLLIIAGIMIIMLLVIISKQNFDIRELRRDLELSITAEDKYRDRLFEERRENAEDKKRLIYDEPFRLATIEAAEGIRRVSGMVDIRAELTEEGKNIINNYKAIKRKGSIYDDLDFGNSTSRSRAQEIKLISDEINKDLFIGAGNPNKSQPCNRMPDDQRAHEM